MDLSRKVALVTGGSSGIGRAIAKSLADAGARVAITGRDEKKLTETARALGVHAIHADVSREADVLRTYKEVLAKFQDLDILINNAGIEFKHPFTEFPFDLWQKVIAVDLTGPFLCAQAAAKQMIQQGNGGRIINISSIHEDLPMPTNAPYCAAKGGLRMLMRTIAVELAPHKITVNNIGPGAIYTPIDADVQAQPEIEKQLMAEIPLGRWGKPEEVAGLAVYLASEEAAYCTGSTFFIDGGMLRQAGSL
jgi:glucose 1-dehydrogenase